MQDNLNQRKRHAILGALVADAASLGFHWLYDPAKILELSQETPEFRTPSSSDFEGSAGYFAHAGKRSGEFSQYGDQTMVMLKSLAANHGEYDKAHYERQFCEYFGYGGEYVGYIDRPTRDTLNNLARAEHEAIECSKSIPFEGDASTRRTLTTKVLACVKQSQGAALEEQLEVAVRQTHDDDALVNYAQTIAAGMHAIAGFHGADDDQLPALAKLPPLIARYAGNSELPSFVESAVRVTNNNELAVQFGYTAAAILEATLNGADAITAVSEGCKDAAAPVRTLVNESLALKDENNTEVTQKFGMACSLVYGVPSLTHNLVSANSFRQAVRRNIYAGGDSCGRSILLGAVLGATFGIGGDKGIPEEWLSRLVHRDQVTSLLNELFN